MATLSVVRQRKNLSGSGIFGAASARYINSALLLWALFPLTLRGGCTSGVAVAGSMASQWLTMPLYNSEPGVIRYSEVAGDPAIRPTVGNGLNDLWCELI